MGATSEPVAHQGIPVALPDGLYQRFIEQIVTEGAIRCSLTGPLRHLPSDFDPVYRGLVGVPQLYVLVDQLESPASIPDAWFIADGAVMVEARSAGRPPEGTWDLADGIFAAFVSFFPRMPNAVNMAVQWLTDIYVGEVLDGRVLTDFDEQIRRFDGTTFSLEQVMGGRVSAVDAERLLIRCGASPHETQQFIQRIETVNGDVRNINVSGSGNVVASEGSAAAGPGGAAAIGGGSASVEGTTVNVGQPPAVVSLADRAKSSRWVKFFGVIALIATAAATVLVALGITGIGIAGYILAVIAVVAGVIPLFRSDG
jgi:hypothetical protein